MPHRRAGRVGLWLIWLAELVGVIALLVALTFAVGPVVAVLTGVFSVPALVYGARRGLKIRHAARDDPALALRLFDRDATRFGKLFAGLAFAMIGIGFIAIVMLFATHT